MADSVWIRRNGRRVLRNPNGYAVVIAVRDKLWIGRSANPDDTLQTIQQWCPRPARLVKSQPIIAGDEFTRLYAACSPYRVRKDAGWYRSGAAAVLEA